MAQHATDIAVGTMTVIAMIAVTLKGVLEYFFLTAQKVYKRC